MSEWWTYEISNFLLFSPGTYDRLLESYNRELWPWHAVAILAGLAAVALLAPGRGRRPSCVGAVILALAWAHVAWAFHFERYASINWAARWFGAAFAVQGILLVATAALARESPREPSRPIRTAGHVLALFGILILPPAEVMLGRPWVHAEVFGLFPDATAIVTLGILLARGRPAGHLFVIPLVWCVIGAGTLAAMNRPGAALVLSCAALAVLALAWELVSSRRKERSTG